MARFTSAAVLVVICHIASICANAIKPKKYFNATMPAKCGDMNFCTEIPEGYPETEIERLLEGTDVLLDDGHEPVVQRFGDNAGSSPEDLCTSVTHTLPIYQIKDNANRTRFVVQSEKKFKQIIRIEQCKEPGIVRTGVRYLDNNAVEAARITCFQCMLNYKFLVLSLNGTSLETVDVKGGLPVCCSCRSL